MNSKHGLVYAESELNQTREPTFGGVVEDFTKHMKKNAPKYEHINYDFAFCITG